jgi:apolipoprotein N-acyltransferase
MVRPAEFRPAEKSPLILVAIAALSGILMSLATAPLNAFPLAWVALAPLWILVQTTTWPRWWILPLVWGVGYHGLALSWITGLHPLTWMGIPWLGSVAIVAFAWGFITLWGAVMVWIWAWGVRRCRNPVGSLRWQSLLHLLIPTALWCGLEWLWSLGPLYWTSLSYTQSPGNRVILHWGQISGPLTVTAAIVVVNGGLALGWLRYRRAQKAGERSRSWPLIRSRWGLPIALCVLLHLVGWGLMSRPLDSPLSAALKVGIIQGNVPTRIKLSGEGMRRAIAVYTRGYESLADQQADAVLTPEGAMPMLWEGDRARQSPLYQAVRQRRVPLWLGTFMPISGSSEPAYTQSLVTLNPEGEITSRFNKIKLVPLGEYIPWSGVLGKLVGRLSPLRANMQPGTLEQTFDTPFGRAIASICYESAFPAQFRNQAAAGGEFILTVSNLDPYSEVLMAQHEAQDLMRAIETDRWAVRATNTGYSGLIDPHGQVLWRSRSRIDQTHIVTLYRRQTQTLYVRWGNWLTPLLILTAGGFWLFARRPSPQGERVR